MLGDTEVNRAGAQTSNGLGEANRFHSLHFHLETAFVNANHSISFQNHPCGDFPPAAASVRSTASPQMPFHPAETMHQT